MRNPLVLIVVGFVMVVAAVVLLWLIVMQILPSTFFLNLFSFTISVAGLFMGIIGSASYVKVKRNQWKKDE